MTINAPICQRNLISILDLTKEEILSILSEAQKIKESLQKDSPLKGKLMASCFFEPSTRTRLSFEAAMKQLGGDVIGFSEGSSTSASKKETLFDTIKMIGHYADLIVMRHPLEGAARLAVEATDKPIINAGDGANQHPTQTLLDLFSIQETQKKLQQVHIGFTGDLKYGRAVRSLVHAASLFQMRIYFVVLPGLEPPKQTCDELKSKGILFSFHNGLEEILPKLDILYMTRLQKERHPSQAMPTPFILKPEMLKAAKPTFKILHPLPRVDEINRLVDETPYAHYFTQAKNGLYVRKALLSMILGEE